MLDFLSKGLLSVRCETSGQKLLDRTLQTSRSWSKFRVQLNYLLNTCQKKNNWAIMVAWTFILFSKVSYSKSIVNPHFQVRKARIYQNLVYSSQNFRIAAGRMRLDWWVGKQGLWPSPSQKTCLQKNGQRFAAFLYECGSKLVFGPLTTEIYIRMSLIKNF